MAVVPHQNHLLSSQHYRHHTLRLRRLGNTPRLVNYVMMMSYLGGFVNEDSLEKELGESWVPSSHTCAADDVRILRERERERERKLMKKKKMANQQQLSLALSLESSVSLLISC